MLRSAFRSIVFVAYLFICLIESAFAIDRENSSDDRSTNIRPVNGSLPFTGNIAQGVHGYTYDMPAEYDKWVPSGLRTFDDPEAQIAAAKQSYYLQLTFWFIVVAAFVVVIIFLTKANRVYAGDEVSGDYADRLDTLDKLRRSGALSEELYQQKKLELLNFKREKEEAALVEKMMIIEKTEIEKACRLNLLSRTECDGMIAELKNKMIEKVRSAS